MPKVYIVCIEDFRLVAVFQSWWDANEYRCRIAFGLNKGWAHSAFVTEQVVY